MARAPTIYFGPYWWVFVLLFLVGLILWTWHRWPVIVCSDEDYSLPLSPEEEEELRHLYLLETWDGWGLTAQQLRRIEYLERRHYAGR